MPRIETSGGEKWMEIAFINAVLRAPRFPPHDPWLSGFAISYYYLGYVIMAMVIRLAAVPATVGFNLGIATLFALTCTGAYGLVYSLLAEDRPRMALWSAFLGPLLVAVTANLEGFLEVLHARGLFSAGFWRWLDVRSLNVPPPPLAEGSWMPTRYIWWWQASRVLHDYAPWHTAANPAEWEVIDEFPAFSFLLGDMHPHVLVLPFVLLALALAFNLLRRRDLGPDQPRWRRLALPLPAWELLITALCLGGLGFLNTWDFPIYFFVMVAAFALGSYRTEGRLALGPATVFAGMMAVGGFGLYLPFWIGLRSQAAGIAPNLFNGTRLPLFLVMFGPLLFPIVAWVAAKAWRRRVNGWDVATWALAVCAGLFILLALALFISPTARHYLVAWRTGTPIPGLEHIPNARELVMGRLQARLLSFWTPLLLAGMLATVALTVLRARPAVETGEDEEDDREILSPHGLFFSLLVGVGALLTLAVEFVYLRDVFGTRMNTVFKFYFQAWVMWAIAAAYALAWLLRQRDILATVTSVVALLLVGAGLVYLPLAIPTRAAEHGSSPTLDGAAHLYRSEPADFAAIDWLNETVDGRPVILEAPGISYDYEGRVSAFTGLPTVLGWAGHEQQWRGSYEEQAEREPDIERLYSTTNLPETLRLLDRYEIRYVYVGPEERRRYPAPGLAKFDRWLDVVYETDDVTIYWYPPSLREEDVDDQLPFYPEPDEREPEPE
jgi:YYY domain-containing protein